MRALAFHQCGPRSIPGPSVICGLSLLLVVVLAPRVFLRVQKNEMECMGIRCASSHMGPAGLPRLAPSNCSQGRLHQGRFNNHIVLSSMNIVLQLSELRLSTSRSNWNLEMLVFI